MKYDPQATFESSLAPNGVIYWTRHSVEEYFGTGALSSFLSVSAAITTKLVVDFPNVDWNFLQSVYGWAALQWQAWARGHLYIHGTEPETILLYTDHVLEFWLDDQHYFGGDFYAYRRAPLVLRLSPGDHLLNLRLVRDVRSMGGVGLPNMSIDLKAEVANRGLAILNGSLLLPETVSGRPASPYGSVCIANTSDDWINIYNVEWDGRSGGINSLMVGYLVPLP